MMFLVPLPVYLLSAVPSPPAENMPDRAPGGAMVAQTIVPADDGTGTVVGSQGDRIQITGGSRSRDGGNLFHSFDRFNLDRGHTANFLSSPEIQNIFSRVTGGDASVINGTISVIGGGSNLFLINPAGILFGSDARLNVPGDFAAIAATGMGFGDQWFATIGDNNWAELVGEPSQFAFGLPQAGSIVNLGNLSVLPGGDVTLMGGTVLNAGKISAPGGRITLAAVPGESAIRISRSNHLLSLEIESAAAIARSVSGTLTPLSLPQLLAGGGVGGETRAIANPDGTIAISGSGIEIDPQTGDAIASGTLDVSGDRGSNARAQVNVLGNRVAVLDGRIDASGATGGGEIRIGGDWRGSDALPQADRAVVDRESEIVANARYHGDGGRVIVWSDNQTQFAGTIRATGGDRGGNGGVVEVSGKEFLQFSGGVDTSAPAGSVGTLLLDPKNITIAAQGSDAIAPNDGFGEQVGTTATIAGADLAAAIDLASVTLQANNDIIIDDTITASTPGHGLTLQAGRSISFTQQGKITLAGGDFTAMINDASAIASDRDLGANPQFLMNAGSQIITNGGNITLSRGNLVGGNVGNVSLSGATLDSGTGNIAIVGDAVTGHGIHLDNQTVVQSSDGTISLTGTGDASGTNLTSNYGIYIRNGSIVESTGIGEIILNGTGGSGTDFNYGIWIRGNNTRVSSTDGNLTLNGTGGGIGTDNHGVYLLNSQVESSGTGSVRLRGIGASGTNVNYGILVRGMDARVSVAEGNLDFLGTAMGSGTSNIGIYLDNGTVVSSGSANLQFAGTGAGGAPGVRVRDGAIAAQSGAIALSGDEIDLEGTTEVRGQGRVQLQPLDPTVGISVGGTVSDGRLNLDDSDIATLQPGFDQIVVGSDIGSGAIALAGDVTVSDSIRLQSPNPGGEINTTGYTLSATGAIALEAAGDIATGPISTLQSSGAIAISSENGRIDTSGGTLDTSATGNAGNISLSAPVRVSVGNIDSTGLGNSGNLEITSSEIDFRGTSVRGQGVIRLQTDDPSRDIAIANSDNSSAALDLTAIELQTLHPDWGEIIIGQSDSTATITLHPFNFESPVSLLGGSTLIGSDRATDWKITNPDSGTLSGFQSTLSFTNIENLTGGTLSDSFIFTNNGRISGNLDGVDGTDTLDYSNANFNATINLATQSATGIGGTLSSVENFLGNTTAYNTLIGPNSENSWNLTDIHQGTVGTVSFSGIQTLQGGNQTDKFVLAPDATFSQINGGDGNNTLVAADTANIWEINATDSGILNSTTKFSQIQNLTGGAIDDTFKFRNNARISGNLFGVGETDKLDYSNATFDVTVNLAQQSASGVGGTISSIESVVGNPLQSNTLMGDNSENNWTIGNFSGTVGGVNFSEFQTLRGGSKADNFSLAADANLSQIVGGDGNNTLVAADMANVWEIIGVNSGMLNSKISFSQIQNLTGGNVDDTFKFAGNGRIDGNLQGVAISDTLDYSNYNNDVTVNLAENRATGVGGQISSIESVVGNPVQDNKVVAGNTTNIWTLTGTNRGRINGVSFEFVQNLTGGSLDDTFVFADGSRVTGLVDGGTGGYNTLDYSGYTGPVTVDIAGGTATATGGIVNIQAAITPPPVSPEAPIEEAPVEEAPDESEAEAPVEEAPDESEAEAPVEEAPDSGEGEGEAPEAIAPEPVVSEKPAPEAIAPEPVV
ncbi:beta strand repeat-containing protein, partial [Phormidium sp. CCY1219]|uniref:beta strand repeat-containing protein n=1 Tax=Phormidium sp. CCY1219 TaxID=2886104 RepID=UPI002D1E61D4